MANITNVTLPDVGKVLFEGNTYYVVGTQSSATNVWTGNLPEGVDNYYDGLSIEYYLPVAGNSSNATLNLSGKGAKPVYRQGGGGTTTHYPAKSIIHMTYVINSGLNSGNGCFLCTGYYDSNSDSQAYNVRRYYNYMVAGANKVFPYTMMMQLPNGRWESIVTSSSTGTSKTVNSHGFLLNNVLLMYANATYAEGTKIGDTYVWDMYTNSVIDHRYSFNTANDATNGTTAQKPIYLVGTLSASDGLFYLDTTKWWTQTLPTSEDGKIYIYIGDAYDYYRMDFIMGQKRFWYKNGAVREYVDNKSHVHSISTGTIGTANSASIGTGTIGTASSGSINTGSIGTATSASINI